MAKKIRLDFSKTEERSGWNTRHMPEGIHKMRIDSVQETEASDGTAMLVYALVPVDPRFKSRRFPFYCKLQQNQYWKLRDLAVAAGMTIPKKAINFDPNAPVGKLVAAEIEDDEYQGTVRSQVQGTYGLEILEEDGSITDDGGTDDDEESEFEGEDPDAEEDEEEEEYEEEEEEDEEEDLSTLSLPQLRARAKELGIDTAGLKKADLIEEIEASEEVEEDEDELDEEDLEDDDLGEEELEDDEEEDEEEPEPAPVKRRAAPKAAPAGATKRKVQRRR